MRSIRSSRRRRAPDEIEGILGRFRASGLSQHRFALLEGVHPVTLGYWIRRAERQATATARRSLVRVQVKDPEEPSYSRSSAFEVLLRSRRVLRIANDFDAEALRRLVAILDDGC